MKRLFRALTNLSAAVMFCTFYFGLLLPHFFMEHPYSKYFNQAKANSTSLGNKATTLNKERLLASKVYFQKQMPKRNLNEYARIQTSKKLFLAVAIITVRRSKTNDEYGYVMQSAAGVDNFAKSLEFANRTFVFICNTDTQPAQHKYAQFLKSYVPSIERYGASSFTNETFTFEQGKPYRLKIHKQTAEKETYDYTFCLKAAKSLNSKFVLIVQDDAIPHKDLSQVLKYSLEKHFLTEGESSRFAYLKLYYPEKWQGFSFEFDRMLEIVSIGVIGGAVGLLLQYLLSRSRDKLYLKYVLSIALGVTFFVTSAELAGRQNVMELRRVSNQLYQLRPASGCCIPAQLYSTQFIDPLTSYLTSDPEGTHVDLQIPAFFRKRGIPQYQLEPNLFYHIGYHSSLTDLDKNPKHFLINIKR